jgi:hypothetical protein
MVGPIFIEESAHVRRSDFPECCRGSRYSPNDIDAFNAKFCNGIKNPGHREAPPIGCWKASRIPPQKIKGHSWVDSSLKAFIEQAVFTFKFSR